MPSVQPDHVQRSIHLRTCSLCEAMCGIEMTIEDGRILTIRGDDKDPFSRGHICPKAVALQDLHADPDRLRSPMRRTADGWQPVSWDQALDLVAQRLHAIQSAHGRDAVGIYLGNPTVHNLGALLFGPGFLRALRTRNRFSATSADQLPHMFAAYSMFGHQLLMPVPDVDRTGYMLMLGANPLASNGSLMTAPGIRRRLQALQARGGRLVVVDPRRTETARMADEHVFIRPGTDALLLLGILHTLLAEDRIRPERALAHCDGLESLRRGVAPFTPERAAAHTRVPADTIRRLARELAAAEAAVCYGRFGASTQAFGGLCQWAINAINIVTGNLDRAGGAMFTRPAVDLLNMPRGMGASRGSFGRWRTQVRGLPEFAGELPVAALAEEILVPGEDRIRALITFAGNPVLSTPNGAQLDRALASLDFMVSVDPYLNETTRHADIILPPISPLERGHYDLLLHVLAVRNTAKYTPRLFEPLADSRDDWEILLGLQERLQGLRGQRRLRDRLMYAALRRMGADGLLDLGLRLGPYGVGRGNLSMRKLREAPHGIDLGPLAPCLPGRLQTPDKRIALAPALLLQDLARLAEAFPDAGAAHDLPRSAHDNGHARDAQQGPSREAASNGSVDHDDALLLIGRRHLRSNNSWMHNVPMLMRGRPRCTLLMHPEDARRMGLAEGDTACVRSRVGQVLAPVEITDDIMPGTVSLPHGFGHHREGTQQTTARKHAGVSINDLTDETAIDALCGTAAFSGVPVRVSPADAPPPVASPDA